MIDFSQTKAMFHLPEGVIYLDGNSLGPLPKMAKERMIDMLENQWGGELIKAWNSCGWFQQPLTLGNRIAPLIGAEENSVVVGDTLSIKIYQALAAALEIADKNRKIILSDQGNFPTDLYMAEGLVKSLDKGHRIKTVAPEDVETALNDEVAVLMLTEVDYRTGRKHDMKRLTKIAHEKGIITIWDLAHSAGAIPVDLNSAQADFAAGCTYKYLNGGPGAPAFIYVAPHHQHNVLPALSGWMGHNAPFDFDLEYCPAGEISRMRVGTPAVIASSVLEAALDIWEGVSMVDVRAQSLHLSDLFIKIVRKGAPELQLASPKAHDERGSQVSFYHKEGYAIMQALIAEGVIGDFRAPKLIRFGFTPLYLSEEEVINAGEILVDIMANERWNNPKYFERSAVT